MNVIDNLFRTLRSLLLVLPLSFFASCEESEILVLLNPDGSGRVTNKEKVMTSRFGVSAPDDLRAAAVNALAEFMMRSNGVDVWEKMSYSVTEEGDIIVEATALFPDLSKLDLATTADIPNLLTGMKFEKGDSESGKKASIKLVSPVTLMPQQKKPTAPADDAAVAKELQRSRNVWLDAEQHIRPSFEGKCTKVTFHVSGEINSSSNFKKDSKNQVHLKVTAESSIDSLEKIVESDEIATKILKTGAKIMANEGAPPVAPETFNELTFGESKPIEFEFTPGQRIFNYGAALDRAKKQPSALLSEVRELVEQSKEE